MEHLSVRKGKCRRECSGNVSRGGTEGCPGNGPVLHVYALNLVLLDTVTVSLEHLTNRIDFAAPSPSRFAKPSSADFLPVVPEDIIRQRNLWCPLWTVPRRRSFKQPFDGGSYKLRTAIQFCCCSKARGGLQPLSQHIHEPVPFNALKGTSSLLWATAPIVVTTTKPTTRVRTAIPPHMPKPETVLALNQAVERFLLLHLNESERQRSLEPQPLSGPLISFPLRDHLVHGETQHHQLFLNVAKVGPCQESLSTRPCLVAPIPAYRINAGSQSLARASVYYGVHHFPPLIKAGATWPGPPLTSLLSSELHPKWLGLSPDSFCGSNLTPSVDSYSLKSLRLIIGLLAGLFTHRREGAGTDQRAEARKCKTGCPSGSVGGTHNSGSWRGPTDFNLAICVYLPCIWGGHAGLCVSPGKGRIVTLPEKGPRLLVAANIGTLTSSSWRAPLASPGWLLVEPTFPVTCEVTPALLALERGDSSPEVTLAVLVVWEIIPALLAMERADSSPENDSRLLRPAARSTSAVGGAPLASALTAGLLPLEKKATSKASAFRLVADHLTTGTSSFLTGGAFSPRERNPLSLPTKTGCTTLPLTADPLTLATNFFLLGAGSFLGLGFVNASSGGLPSDPDATIFFFFAVSPSGPSILVLMTPVGAILAGIIMETYGRLSAIRLGAIPAIIGWIMIASGRSFTVLLIGRMFTGVSTEEPEETRPLGSPRRRESEHGFEGGWMEMSQVHPTGIEPQSPRPRQLRITRDSVLDRAAIEASGLDITDKPRLVLLLGMATRSSLTLTGYICDVRCEEFVNILEV
uniref:(California timema) hypothetical protein n=1 Tax=Timema californicum TaxID=61474 RepID=A0A7R9JBY4_TIMCA|nr:unnamed protein product [Timema californicum]